MMTHFMAQKRLEAMAIFKVLMLGARIYKEYFHCVFVNHEDSSPFKTLHTVKKNL